MFFLELYWMVVDICFAHECRLFALDLVGGFIFDLRT